MCAGGCRKPRCIRSPGHGSQRLHRALGGTRILLALTNQILSACGKPVLPIESATVEQLVTAGITTVAALMAWWQNNSFTAAAIQADKYLEDKKSQVNK